MSCLKYIKKKKIQATQYKNWFHNQTSG